MSGRPDPANLALVPGAPSPEELEVLLEDAVLLRDPQALSALFEDGAVLLIRNRPAARGGRAIAQLALGAWQGDHSYLAETQEVVQARDIALIVSARGVNVAQRGRDGLWRYAIVYQASGSTD